MFGSLRNRTARLLDAMRQAAAGRTPPPFPVQERDDVGLLEDAFNELVLSVETRLTERTARGQELARMLDACTRDLGSAQERLDDARREVLAAREETRALKARLEPAGRATGRTTAFRFSRFAAGQRVLVVEDNALNRDLARELLRRAGVAVEEAENGRLGLERLKGETFDAVLMDVQMPDMDGLEAVRAIRARQDLKDLPVIAMTAHAMSGDKERFIEAGMSDYVSKPVDRDQLMTVLARYLRPSGSGSLDAVTVPEPERPAEPSAPSSLDLTGGLARASGDPDLYRRLLAAFVREATDVVPRLTALLDAGATKDALDLLHSTKGSAATIGARGLASAAAELESALKADGSHPRRPSAPAHTAPLPSTPRPFDREAQANARVLVERLEQALVAGDFAAMASYEELRALVEDRVGAPLRELGACVERLDFDGARIALGAVAAELERESSS